MKHRTSRQLILAVLIAIALPLFAEPSNKPNIVLIMADDLGYESLVCPGNTEVETPNINRLAASGNHDKLAAAYLVK